MKLGEKIRRARINAGMTQSELAGDFITRNMLSQIENGIAMPSLQTALYISDKLGVDAGLLFSENNDEEMFFLTRKLPLLKNEYAKGNIDKCIELCGDEKNIGDEANLIFGECCIKKAYDLYTKGRLKQALKSAESAVRSVSKTIYSSDSIRFKADIIEEMVAYTAPLLKQTKRKYEEKEFLRNYYKENSEHKVFYAMQAAAESLIESEKYNEALELLCDILKNEEKLSIPLLYTVCSNIEVCYSEHKDYEKAYKYSQEAKRLFLDMQE